MTPQACGKAQEYISVQAAEFQMLSITKLYCSVVAAEETCQQCGGCWTLFHVMRVVAAGSYICVMQ